MPTPVEEIKQRLDIVDFINEIVPLKAAGSNWKARCPFHNEKSPSFMVSRERGSWHCFGCGRGGDVFSFVQEYEGLEFPEALRLLAKRAGVKLESFDPKLQTQRTKVLDALRWVARYYHEVLLKSQEADGVRTYLAERGLTAETIEDFQIGYAPNQFEVTFEALKKKGFAEDDIFQAGLTMKKERGVGYYDRFRGRIMFPINDAHGAVVAFSARVYEPNVDPRREPPPKYINSPQTLVYNKSTVLFALDKAKGEIKKATKVVVVEGQMDCIASHQAGVTNVVATSGTALTRDQVQNLKRFTTNLVFAFDQDTAGAQAVLRGVDQALQASMDVTVVTLPSGKDPDELIRKDPAAWTAAITKAKPVLEYFFDRSFQDRDLTKVQDKKTIARELLPIVAKVADPIEQNHYLERLAQAVGVEAARLREAFPKPARVAGSPAPAASPVALRTADHFRAVSERLLALLLHDPKMLGQVMARLEPGMLVGDDLERLYKTLVVWYTQQHFASRPEIERLVSTVESEQQERFTRLFLLADKEFSEPEAGQLENDLVTMMEMLRRRWLSQQLRDLEQEIRQLESGPQSGAPEKLASLLERFQRVTEQLRELA